VERDVHLGHHGLHPDGADHLLELLDGACPRRDAAVGDEPGGLVGPLLVQVVDRVLQRRRVAVVVLGRDEDDGVGGRDRRAPALRVRVLVAAQPRVVGLVEQGQIDGRQVDEPHVERGVLPGAVGEPLGDRQPGPPGPCAGEDDHEVRHVVPFIPRR
jgi:hypothetical protein